MGDSVIYTFENTTPYVTDMGLEIDWQARYNIWPGFTYAAMSAIATAVGATPFTSEAAPKFVSDITQKIFDPRKLRFHMSDPSGYKATIDVVVRDRTLLATQAVAVRTAISGIGAYSVKKIDVIGEVWRDIYDWVVVPLDKVATVDAPRLNQRRRHSGRMDYDSDSGVEKIEKFSMQTDSTIQAPPSVYLDAISAAIENVNSPRSNDTSPSEPRYYKVKSLWTDPVGGAIRPQQTKIPVCDDDEDTILAVGELLSAITSVNSLSYHGECIAHFEKMIPA